MGAPTGNQNAVKDWGAAIRRALARAEQDEQSIRRLSYIADKLLDKAAEGDLGAMKELGDRLDGKPAQAITGADGGPVEAVFKWAKES